MIRTNNIVSEFLSSFEDLYINLKVDVDESSGIFDSDYIKSDDSVFISNNTNESELDSNSIFSAVGKDTIDSEDEILKLFSKNKNDFLYGD